MNYECFALAGSLSSKVAAPPTETQNCKSHTYSTRVLSRLESRNGQRVSSLTAEVNQLVADGVASRREFATRHTRRPRAARVVGAPHRASWPHTPAGRAKPEAAVRRRPLLSEGPGVHHVSIACNPSPTTPSKHGGAAAVALECPVQHERRLSFCAAIAVCVGPRRLPKPPPQRSAHLRRSRRVGAGHCGRGGGAEGGR